MSHALPTISGMRIVQSRLVGPFLHQTRRCLAHLALKDLRRRGTMQRRRAGAFWMLRGI